MTTFVTKIDGRREEYNEEKIRLAAARIGVPHDLQTAMLQSIRDRLYDGIPTAEILTLIKDFLHSSRSPYLAFKYNLKEALSQLGPSGYPFEKYVALLLSEIGYVCVVNQVIAGSCITHEVDVVAEQGGIKYFIEAKFHSSPAQRTDVRVALYIKARYDDLASVYPGDSTRPWIVTNTRFSTDAIKYAECQSIRLTSWGYPKGEGIMDMIEHTGLHPITILDPLSREDRIKLMNSGIVTCRQLLNPENQSFLPRPLMDSLRPELERLCQSTK